MHGLFHVVDMLLYFCCTFTQYMHNIVWHLEFKFRIRKWRSQSTPVIDKPIDLRNTICNNVNKSKLERNSCVLGFLKNLVAFK